MKSYKAPNKRIIRRAGNGKFRKTILADLGAGCCQKCGKFYTFDSSMVMDGPFIDPMKMAQHKVMCADCMKTKTKEDL